MRLKRNLLGRTGIEVTELCFGALPMGPLQKGLSLAEGTALISHALRAGIDFVDTAQSYGTYAPIREAIRATGIRPVVATKSHARTYAEMERAIQEALAELGLERIDLFHLHAARVSVEVFAERAGAIDCLVEYRKRGIVRAIGISTHDTRIVHAAVEHDEIDVVFPIFNRTGRGILSGTVEEMAQAIRLNHERGKGVYLMKALAGGTLLDSFAESLDFARRVVPSHSIALGMVHPTEVDYNVAVFAGGAATGPPPTIGGGGKVFRIVTGLCRGCGSCLPSCHSAAIALAHGKARIDTQACLRCGYCTVVCPQFAIRVT